jgi:methylmalonyl-CoA mutase N-terminal domain/subunit
VTHIYLLLANVGRRNSTYAVHRRAVETSPTVGEISDAMRLVYGEYQETVVI